MKRMFGFALAFITGLLPGYFLVLNFMFSDVISVSERYLSFLVVVVAYLILGAAFGLAGRASGLNWGFWLSLPALILALVYTFRETGTLATNLVYAAAAFGAAVAGAHFGGLLSGKRRL